MSDRRYKVVLEGRTPFLDTENGERLGMIINWRRDGEVFAIAAGRVSDIYRITPENSDFDGIVTSLRMLLATPA